MARSASANAFSKSCTRYSSMERAKYNNVLSGCGQSCRKGPEWRKNVFVYGLHPVTLRRESIPDVPARHPNDSDVRVPYCTSCVENRSAPYNRSEPKPVPESIPSCGSALCRDIRFHTSRFIFRGISLHQLL